MGTKDPRIDAYIERAATFAQPILVHVRKVVHEACPDVEETLKWGHPTFMHKGILCGLAAFKQHCALALWKGALILDGEGRRVDEAWGQMGRITKISDLPSRQVLIGYVKKAAALNEQGVAVPKKPAAPKRAIPVPKDLAAALARNAKARATFEAFSPSHRREYLEWITEAKGEDTRERRVATAIEWMAAGKSRMWKYERKATGAKAATKRRATKSAKKPVRRRALAS